MNDDARDGANNLPVSIKNEATPDASIFTWAAPALTSGTAAAAAAAAAGSTIVHDAHIPPSGGKQRANPFSPVNLKNMAKVDTIDTTPESDTSADAYTDASAQYPDLKVSKSPYSLRNRNFPTSSISTKKPQKDKKRQTMIKLLYSNPLYPNFFTLFPQRIQIDQLYQSLTLHIHWEIAVFVPPPPPPNKTEEAKITIDDTVNFHYPPVPDASTASPNDDSS